MSGSINRFFPIAGGLVQVSFFDGNHKIQSAFAHVLSVSPSAIEDELPVIAAVYPKQPAVDSRTLSGPDWAKAFQRQAGIPHVSSQAVYDRTSSIAYMALYDATQEYPLEDLFEAPEGQDPALRNARQDTAPALRDSIQMATVTQAGTSPTPTVQSPLVNDQYSAEHAYANLDNLKLQRPVGVIGQPNPPASGSEAVFTPTLTPASPVNAPAGLAATDAPPITDVIPEAAPEGYETIRSASGAPALVPATTHYIETKHYADGSSATGPGPLPDTSGNGSPVTATYTDNNPGDDLPASTNEPK